MSLQLSKMVRRRRSEERRAAENLAEERHRVTDFRLQMEQLTGQLMQERDQLMQRQEAAQVAAQKGDEEISQLRRRLECELSPQLRSAHERNAALERDLEVSRWDGESLGFLDLSRKRLTDSPAESGWLS